MTLQPKFLWILMAILLFSCDKKRVFDQYKSVGDRWEKDSIINFNIDQADTLKKYNLFLNIRNNDDYEFNNLFLIIAIEHPDGLTKIDTMQYEMANPDGSLMGQGFWHIKENKLFFKEKYQFKKAGNYKISIQQAVRKTGKIQGQQYLNGISEVGFRIEKTE